MTIIVSIHPGLLKLGQSSPNLFSVFAHRRLASKLSYLFKVLFDVGI